MERETVEQARASEHRTAGACGCTPHTSPDVGATAETGEPLALPEVDADQPAPEPEIEAEPEPEPMTGSEAPRRTVKLVLTLQPTDDRGYRALLAIGADGCDPVLRSATVDGLPAALDGVPALLAEAEAQWQARPCNPAVAPSPGGRAVGGRRRSNDAGDTAPRVEPDPRPTTIGSPGDAAAPAIGPVAPRKRAVGDQLTLFG